MFPGISAPSWLIFVCCKFLWQEIFTTSLKCNPIKNKTRIGPVSWQRQIILSNFIHVWWEHLCWMLDIRTIFSGKTFLVFFMTLNPEFVHTSWAEVIKKIHVYNEQKYQQILVLNNKLLHTFSQLQRTTVIRNDIGLSPRVQYNRVWLYVSIIGLLLQLRFQTKIFLTS